MLSNNKKVIAIVGPTCTGKSSLAMDIAAHFKGEIVNADSMQVYRHFDIGTAKPDATSREIMDHHLIDIVEPSEIFNALMFKEKADEAIGLIWSREKIPVLVGGTGLYMRALTYGLFEAPTDIELRERLKEDYEKDPLLFYEQLKEVDPAYAMRISHRDKVRVVRAMEVFRLTGKPVSRLEEEHGFKEARYNMLKICLGRNREDLYRRINGRVEEMLLSGWIDEVRRLLSMGYNQTSKPFSSIGYREILLYIKGEISYEDMVEDIKKKTRHYAKRQFTWFSKEKDLWWYEYPEEIEAIRDKTSGFLIAWN
ncbi:MAG: tRNA (adenosine(37)-N6)-dimethylallyltransferase MiaA [Syntrophus sp. (in: bacteria)]|nr:tRNA (adenosine(37)-N6)-dimethylallyltransferase MiaA [Syntrophus sp. (in: bacteria)]